MEKRGFQARALSKWMTEYLSFEPDICITSTIKSVVDTADVLNISNTAT